MINSQIWAILLAAIMQVESGGVAQVGDQHLKNHAYGVLQIRQPCLQDVNQLRGTSYTLADVHRNSSISRWVAVQYLRHWGAVYERRTGKIITPEVLSRIWNGGPNGWKRKSTEVYWAKVQRRMR